ncbi:peptidoglycan DD-metalloendopeptidase family protein [Moritella sp. Urea-trap-13]|uniref:peptidoglycan DD-metalloendopeptidase family protein n=1 Tax=Moritella sp. Urea-trap-13 TaxID=2058327 RepID=UPI000C343C37|nr:peptidoglycan DD-metalloendopeptidase family protein [Moritella sp. Urea-trap-13]PKH05428.1 lipoprotein NlpD [Moritella sp. Urea-trap-13]
MVSNSLLSNVRRCNQWHRIAFYLLLVQLVGCASGNHSPAPVTSVQGYKVELRSHIKTPTYRVNKGETLYAIAWRSNQDFKFLAALNQIPDPYQIYPGQVLKLQGKIPAPVYKKPTPVKVAKTTNSNSNKNTAKTSIKAPSKQLVTPAKTKTVIAKASPPVQHKAPTKYKAPVKAKPAVRVVKPKVVVSNNKLKWSWPASGKLISTYSTSKSGNQGVNIAGSLGRNIIAAENGRVVYSGNGLRGYGNLIIIKHNDDYLSAYAYNQKLLVKEQQWVKAGQKIATMGNNGPNSGAELYFEIRYRGKPVNPMRYLPKR